MVMQWWPGEPSIYRLSSLRGAMIHAITGLALQNRGSIRGEASRTRGTRALGLGGNGPGKMIGNRGV